MSGKRIEEIRKEMGEYRKIRTYIKKFDAENSAKDFLLKTISDRFKRYKKHIDKLEKIVSGEDQRLIVYLEEDTEDEEYYMDFIKYIEGLEFDYGYIDYEIYDMGLYSVFAELHTGLDVKIITYKDYEKEVKNGTKRKNN